MSKIKGVVMRVKDKKTVVYTEEGDFIQITTPAQKPLVGQTINFSFKPRTFFATSTIIKYAATAAVLIFILTTGFMYPLMWPLGGAVASVELNINNGMSLHLDKKGVVTGVHSAGSEVSSADNGLSLEGLDVYQAVKLIVEDAGRNGDFIHEPSVVMVSVVPVGKSGVETVDSDKLRGVVHKELLKQNTNGIVMVGKLSRETGSKAQSLGMTVNNYLIYERCRQGGLDVHADVFRGRNIRDAVNEVNVSLAKLFPDEYIEVTGQDNDKSDDSKQINTKKDEEVEEMIVQSLPQGQEQKHVQGVNELKRIQPSSRGSAQREIGLRV